MSTSSEASSSLITMPTPCQALFWGPAHVCFSLSSSPADIAQTERIQLSPQHVLDATCSVASPPHVQKRSARPLMQFQV